MKSLTKVWFAAMLAVSACGGDSKDTIDKIVEDLPPPDQSAIATCPPSAAEACPAGTKQAGTGCELSSGDLVTVSGTAVDFQSDRALNGAIVHLMDNDTGKPTGACGVTNASGELAFKVPKGKKIGFGTFYDGAKDTYQFNQFYDAAADENFFSVSSITAQLIPGLIGFSPDETKGIVAGTVYNKYGKAITDTSVTYKVRVKGGSDAYYFNDDLPTDRETQPALNPADALFVAFDLEPGKQTLELLANGDVTATTDNVLFAFPDSVAISNITCTGCEK